MQKKVTIYDVATRAGVSSSTVSRVLNDSPRVAAHTRTCVRQAMRELGYVPDRSARTLARGKNKENDVENGAPGATPGRVQVSEEKKLLYFEGAWEAKEGEAIRNALSNSQTGAVLWLCVKTHVQGTQTCIALALDGAREVVVAETPQDLAMRLLQQEGAVSGERRVVSGK